MSVEGTYACEGGACDAGPATHWQLHQRAMQPQVHQRLPSRALAPPCWSACAGRGSPSRPACSRWPTPWTGWTLEGTRRCASPSLPAGRHQRRPLVLMPHCCATGCGGLAADALPGAEGVDALPRKHPSFRCHQLPALPSPLPLPACCELLPRLPFLPAKAALP